jgi:Mrp family chromosome partitioning ATPase
MEPIDFLGGLRRSWRLLVVLTLLGGLIGVLLPTSQPKAHRKHGPTQYTATAVVGSAPNGQGSLVGGQVTAAQILFDAGLAAVKDATVTAIGLTPSALENYLMSAALVPVAGSGKASKRTQSTSVTLTGYNTKPAQAVAIANAYAHALQDYVNNIAAARQSVSPRAGVSSATVNTGFVIEQAAGVAIRVGKPKPAKQMGRKVRGLIGLAAGLVLGAAIVLLREVMNNRLRNPTRARVNFGFPIVVEVPVASGAGAEGVGLEVADDPNSLGAEAFRMLRMSVLFEQLAPQGAPSDRFGSSSGNGSGPALSSLFPGPSSTGPQGPQAPALSPHPSRNQRKIVLVVSAGSEPSRPRVAANLAAVYAEGGERVIIISTEDLESDRPGGGEDKLTAEIRPEDIQERLEPSRLENVSRLQLHPFVHNSARLVTRAPLVFEAASQVCDVIIVETPPLLAFHHAEALAQAVDVVLVVGEIHSTTNEEAKRSGDLLRRIAAPVLGVVLTNVRLHRRDARHLATRRPRGPEDRPAAVEVDHPPVETESPPATTTV